MQARCSASPPARTSGSGSWGGYLLPPCFRVNWMVGTVRGMCGPADRLGSEFVNGEVGFQTTISSALNLDHNCRRTRKSERKWRRSRRCPALRLFRRCARVHQAIGLRTNSGTVATTVASLGYLRSAPNDSSPLLYVVISKQIVGSLAAAVCICVVRRERVRDRKSMPPLWFCSFAVAISVTPGRWWSLDPPRAASAARQLR
jgi:hypothetical protein